MPHRIVRSAADLARLGARIAAATLLMTAAAGCTTAHYADSGRGASLVKTAASYPIIGVGY